jgi:hypothetical protein
MQLLAHAEVGEDVSKHFIGHDTPFASNVGEIIENKSQVFGNKVSAQACL